jgi:hypothetical protein
MKKEFYLSCPSKGCYEVLMSISNNGISVARISVLTFAEYEPGAKAVLALQLEQALAIF